MKKSVFKSFLSVITSIVFIISVFNYSSDRIIKTNSITLSENIIAGEHITSDSGVKSDNPFDKQDDMEVPYDSSYWIQPKEWNTPTIDPRDYNGGLMIWFDKIGLEPEYAKGKVQRVYFSMCGATEPVGLIKFHIFYDTRLTVVRNTNGDVLTPGKAIAGFTTGSSMIEEGKLVFYAYSNEDTLLSDSSIFTIDFIVPETADAGEIYPIGIMYQTDDVAVDMFIDSEKSNAGKLQMTYLFTKGIYNGYIKIQGEKKTTTTTTETTAITTTTTTSTEPVASAGYMLGDVNMDGLINASDGSSVLEYYAKASTNQDGGFDDNQKHAADVNDDGSISAVDASYILSYYAYLSTTNEEIISLEEFIRKSDMA